MNHMNPHSRFLWNMAIEVVFVGDHLRMSLKSINIYFTSRKKHRASLTYQNWSNRKQCTFQDIHVRHHQSKLHHRIQEAKKYRPHPLAKAVDFKLRKPWLGSWMFLFGHQWGFCWVKNRLLPMTRWREIMNPRFAKDSPRSIRSNLLQIVKASHPTLNPKWEYDHI